MQCKVLDPPHVAFLASLIHLCDLIIYLAALENTLSIGPIFIKEPAELGIPIVHIALVVGDFPLVPKCT
jgi:hypothetical protein